MNSTTLTPDAATRPDDDRERARRDVSTIGLIGLAHGTSHFHHLLLPPLFPLFIRDFGLTYSELGLLVTVFFLISGVGQALSGFLVDKVGARPVLYAAMGSFIAASLAGAMAQGYGGLMVAAALAGLGNAPFHPVDFTILNKRVSPQRLGHAFSVHGISGNLGWAVSPVFLIGLSSAFDSWRAAYLGSALVAVAVLALLVLQRDAIDDRQGAWSHQRAEARTSAGATTATVDEHPMAFLRLPSVWLCFSFFFWTTAALSAIQSFASPALGQMYGLPASSTAFVVTWLHALWRGGHGDWRVPGAARGAAGAHDRGGDGVVGAAAAAGGFGLVAGDGGGGCSGAGGSGHRAGRAVTRHADQARVTTGCDRAGSMARCIRAWTPALRWPHPCSA